jgi:hypothetical protein
VIETHEQAGDFKGGEFILAPEKGAAAINRERSPP